MGPEDNANSMDNLYLITEDGYKVSMNATMFCIPDLVKAEMDEDLEPNDVTFRLCNSYKESFTLELTNESAKRIKRFCRRMKRYERRQMQQYKRKLAKEKKHGLLHKET